MNQSALTSAQAALEDAKLLHTELLAVQQTGRELSEQLLAERALTDQLRRDIESWKQLYVAEKAAAKRAMLHAASLVSKIDSLQAICTSIRGAAAEVAQKLAEEALDEPMSEDDLAKLKKLAGTRTTVLPPNELREAYNPDLANGYAQTDGKTVLLREARNGEV